MPSTTTTATTTPTSPGGFGAGLVGSGGTGNTQPNPAGGTSTVDITQQVTIPADWGPPNGFLNGSGGDLGATQTVSISDLIGYLNANPKVAQEWATYLHDIGQYTAPSSSQGRFDQKSFDTAMENVAGQAVAAGQDLSTYIQSQIQSGSGGGTGAGSNAPPGTYGSARFYRGGVTEINLTPADAVQAAGDAVAQQLLGRDLTKDEVDQVTQRLNAAEYAKGSVDVHAAQLQQATYLESLLSYQQGGATGGGGGGGGGTPSPNAIPNVPWSGTKGSGAALDAIPSDYASVLVQMAQNGQLSGLDPNLVAAISLAETNWNAPGGGGGAANSSGYGGYFGLSASSADVTAQGTQAFQTQASIAAATFAGLVKQFGGDVMRAEAAYQNGPNGSPTSPGQQVLQDNGVDGTVDPNTVSANAGGGGGGGTATSAAGAENQTGLPTVSDVTQVQPGQAAQVGTPQNLNLPTGQAELLPPVAAVAQAPLTPDQQTASYIKNVMSDQFQAHNLLNVFDTIAKMAGKAVSADIGKGLATA